ncbi:MAG: regulatory protein RecX [Acidobacteriota bacterium]
MDAYTTALALLARRELSARQLRDRLARRRFDPADIDDAVDRLTREGTLDDRRVARAVARLEGAIRGRGRRRVLRKLQQAGVSEAVARDAVQALYDEEDEGAILDKAIERRLGGGPPPRDPRAMARLVRALTAQGFAPGDILGRLRRRRAGLPDE